MFRLSTAVQKMLHSFTSSHYICHLHLTENGIQLSFMNQSIEIGFKDLVQGLLEKSSYDVQRFSTRAVLKGAHPESLNY